jgi:hypothetical protein
LLLLLLLLLPAAPAHDLLALVHLVARGAAGDNLVDGGVLVDKRKQLCAAGVVEAGSEKE